MRRGILTSTSRLATRDKMPPLYTAKSALRGGVGGWVVGVGVGWGGKLQSLAKISTSLGAVKEDEQSIPALPNPLNLYLGVI